MKTALFYALFVLSLGLLFLPQVRAQGADAQKDNALHAQSARVAPDWIVDGVLYQINPRAFTPEGTLSKAAEKLPALSDLGVTVVYLCPVFVADDDPRTEFWSPRQKKSGMNNPRNPYRMKDYFHVDPEYGTDDDLKAFIAQAHRLGMRVLLDMVYLHCGPSATVIAEHPDFVKRDKDGKILNAAWSFPGFDFTNPLVRDYFWKNMEYWVTEFDADGFRLDVADGIPLDFWVEARRRLEKIRPDVALLAEGTRPADQIEAMDLNYGFLFFTALDRVMTEGKPASEIRRAEEKADAVRPLGVRFTRYIDNHDIANDDYENRREKKWGDSGLRAALVLCFALDGVPMLYNGQEIADANRHSIFGRLPIDWRKAETNAGKERLAFVRSLIELRRTSEPLRRGTLVWLDNSAPEKIVSFRRETSDQAVTVLVNLKNEPAQGTVALGPGEWAKQFGTGTLQRSGGDTASFEIPAFGTIVVSCE